MIIHLKADKWSGILKTCIVTKLIMTSENQTKNVSKFMKTNVKGMGNLATHGKVFHSIAMLLYLQLSVHFLFLISPAIPIIATTPQVLVNLR